MIDINATLVAQILNFLILLFILSKFAYRPIMDALKARQAKIETSLTAAEKELAAANILKKESEEQLAAARLKAQAIMKEAVDLGEKSREAILQKAMEDNARLLKEAQDEIERKYQQALARLRAEVVIMAVAAAEKVIEKNLDAETNARLVRKFIKDFTKEKYGELV